MASSAINCITFLAEKLNLFGVCQVGARVLIQRRAEETAGAPAATADDSDSDEEGEGQAAGADTQVHYGIASHVSRADMSKSFSLEKLLCCNFKSLIAWPFAIFQESTSRS